MNETRENYNFNSSDFSELFENMLDAFALHEMIFDNNGKPADYKFVFVNSQFEKMTGLQKENILNKTVKEILPGIEDVWIQNYGKVVLTGESLEFENYTLELNKYYHVKAYKTGGNKFAVTFMDISGRKRTELEKDTFLNLLKIIIQPDDLNGLIRRALLHLKEFSKCEAVGIRLKDGDDYPYFETEGFPADFILKETKLCAKDKEGRVIRQIDGEPLLECMCGNILQRRFNPEFEFFTENGSFWTNGTSDLLAGTSESERQSYTRNYCNARGYESVALVPLRTGDEVFGLLQFNDKKKGLFTKGKIEFFEQLADSLALGLAKRKVDKEIIEKEEKYRSLFETMHQGVFYQRADGQLIDANRAALEMLGLTMEEFLGRTSSNKAWNVINSEGRLLEPHEHPSIISLTTGEPIFNFELAVFNNIRNEYVWMVINSKPEFHKGENKPYRAAVTMHEITERKHTEDLLKESNEKYFALYENAPLAYQSLNEDGYIRDVNPMWLNTLGYSRDETLGKWFGSFLHPDYVEHFKINFPAFKKRGYVHDVQFRMKKKDGTFIYVSFEGCIGYTPAGEFKQTYCVFKDITSERNAGIAKEEALIALTKSEKIYKTLVSGLPDVIMRFDNEKRHLFVSDNVSEVVDLKPGDFTGKTHRELGFKEEDCIFWEDAISEVFSKRCNCEREFTFASKSGEISFNWRLIPEFDKDGNVESVLSICRDMSERKKAENEIKKQKEHLSYIIEGANVGTWEWNVQTGETIFNSKWAEMLGYTLEEISPISVETWKMFTHPDDLKASYEILEKHFSGELEYYEAEMRMKHKMGNWVWVLDRGKVISRTIEGEPLWMYGTHLDITERKKAEEAIISSKMTAESYLNLAAEIILSLDINGNIILINDSGCRLLEYEKAELIGKNWFKTCLPENIKGSVFEYFNKLKNSTGGKIETYESVVITKCGQLKYILWHNSILKDENGIFTGTLSSGEDITEKRLATEKLKLKIDELERFNQLTVGREIKMVELKKEINELLVKTGKTEKYKIIE